MRVKNFPKKVVVEELDTNTPKLTSELLSTDSVTVPAVKINDKRFRREDGSVRRNEDATEEDAVIVTDERVSKELGSVPALTSTFSKKGVLRSCQQSKLHRSKEDDAKVHKSVMNLLEAAKEDMMLQSSLNQGDLKKLHGALEEDVNCQQSIMNLLDRAKEDMSAVEPRKRGRPPKHKGLLKKTIIKCKTITAKAEVTISQNTGPKKRGRPRKYPVEALATKPIVITPTGANRDSEAEKNVDVVADRCHDRGRKKTRFVEIANKNTLKYREKGTLLKDESGLDSVKLMPKAGEASTLVRRNDSLSKSAEQHSEHSYTCNYKKETEVLPIVNNTPKFKRDQVVEEETNPQMNIEPGSRIEVIDRTTEMEVEVDSEIVIEPIFQASAGNMLVIEEVNRVVNTVQTSEIHPSVPFTGLSAKEVVVKEEFNPEINCEAKPVRRRGRPPKNRSAAAGSANMPTSDKVTKAANSQVANGMNKKAVRKAKQRQMKLEEKQRKREARKIKKAMKEKLLREQRERRAAKRMKQVEEQLAWKGKKKGRANALSMTAEESEKIYIEGPCDGILPIADMSFCWKIFVLGRVFMDRWLILREIPSNRYGVVSYLVAENTEDHKEGILHVQDANNPFAALPEEMCFLQVQAERGRSELFQTVVDTQFGIATEQSPNYFYYVVQLRESISLKDLWSSYPAPKENSRRKAWGIGTVGRLAADILTIIEVTHEAGFTFRNIDMSHFHLDMRTRRLYMEDASEAVLSTERKDLRMKTGEYVLHNYWRGCVEYAPLVWHRKGRKSIMRVADCAEVLFYMMVDMLGLLTWRGLNNHRIMVCKERFVDENRNNLPVPLIDYWKIVRYAQAIDARRFRQQDDYLLLDGIRGGATVSILDFRMLFDKLLAMYKVFGGMNDEDMPYDFERVDLDCHTKGIPQWEQLEKQFIYANFLCYRLDILKADLEALAMRKEYAMRMAAQTRRERALAQQFPGLLCAADNELQKRNASGFSSDVSDDECYLTF